MLTLRLFLATVTFFSFLSCSKKDSQPDSINQLLDGTWNVAGYRYNDEDRTMALSGYTFKFSADKKITAIKQDTSVIGTWHSDYTTPPEGGELYIEFKFTSPIAAFVDISRRWKLLIMDNEATLLTFDHGIGLSLVKR
jgi:hypothetical protein